MGIVEYLGKLVSLKVVMGVGELFLFFRVSHPWSILPFLCSVGLELGL